jgi:hypothetical protein
MTKKKSLRTLGALALGAVLLATPQDAGAQTSFQGTFVGPHGAFSIGFGHPRYAVGSYAPYGYTVVERPRYGYGFWSPVFVCSAHHVRHAHWVPVKRYRSRWVVVDRPVYYGAPYAHPLERAWGYDRYGHGGHGKGHKKHRH